MKANQPQITPERCPHCRIATSVQMAATAATIAATAATPATQRPHRAIALNLGFRIKKKYLRTLEYGRGDSGDTWLFETVTVPPANHRLPVLESIVTRNTSSSIFRQSYEPRCSTVQRATIRTGEWTSSESLLSNRGQRLSIGRGYHRLNDDYRPIHELCRMFLRYSSISEGVGEIRFSSATSGNGLPE
jgi:hypothetical protein